MGPKSKGALEAPLEFTSVAASSIEEGAESPAPARVPQLPQSLCFNLADTFARYGEVLPNFFQCVFGAVFKTESHLDDALFARCQRIKNLFRHFLQIDVDYGIRR